MAEEERIRMCGCPYPYINQCFKGKKGKIICYLKWLKEKGKKGFVASELDAYDKESN